MSEDRRRILRQAGQCQGAGRCRDGEPPWVACRRRCPARSPRNDGELDGAVLVMLGPDRAMKKLTTAGGKRSYRRRRRDRDDDRLSPGDYVPPSTAAVTPAAARLDQLIADAPRHTSAARACAVSSKRSTSDTIAVRVGRNLGGASISARRRSRRASPAPCRARTSRPLPSRRSSPVEATLAGDDQVGTDHLVVDLELVADELEAGSSRRRARRARRRDRQRRRSPRSSARRPRTSSR